MAVVSISLLASRCRRRRPEPSCRETRRHCAKCGCSSWTTMRPIGKFCGRCLQNWHMKPIRSRERSESDRYFRRGERIGRVFPLILLDAQMPEMDGFAVAEAIKRNPDWRAATVMMLSSAGQRGDAMRCRELGIAAYLTKPVRQSELLDAILTALGTRTRAGAPDAGHASFVAGELGSSSRSFGRGQCQ